MVNFILSQKFLWFNNIGNYIIIFGSIPIWGSSFYSTVMVLAAVFHYTTISFFLTFIASA